MHVEQANEGTKNFKILQDVLASYRPLSTKLFQVCAGLINIQALLWEIADKYTIASPEDMF